jgi:hypothetical protein
VQLTRGRRERPEALADDHDAVRAGHPAEARAAPARIRAAQDLESRLARHTDTVPQARPLGKCRAAYRALRDVPAVYQRPRPTKPSSARTRMTIRMM